MPLEKNNPPGTRQRTRTRGPNHKVKAGATKAETSKPLPAGTQTTEHYLKGHLRAGPTNIPRAD